MKNIPLKLMSLSIVLLVAGCGGGGSGGTTTTTHPVGTVQITSTTATSVAAKGVSSTSQIKSSSAAAPVRAAAGKSSGAANAALALFERVRAKQLQSAGTRAIPSVQTNCSGGGTAVESYTDSNGNGVFDVGDVATVTFTSCVAAGVTENGAISVSVAEMTPVNSPTHIKIASTFTNYHVVSAAEDLLTNGDMALTLDYTVSGNTVTAISFAISGTSFNTVSSVDGTFGITDYTYGMSVTAAVPLSLTIGMMVNSNALAGTIYIYTPSSLTASSTCTSTGGSFNGGSLRINGGGGSYVLLTPDVDCVNVVITGTNGTTPFTVNTTWAAL